MLDSVKRLAADPSIERQNDLLHDPVGLGQDLDDLLIVPDIIPAQHPALAVLQPFLRRLIAADMELPRGGRNLREMLRTIDPHPPKKPLPGGEGLGWGFGARV